MADSIARLFDLSDKVAVVTGAAQGMGQAIALRLAEAGAAVVVVHRGEHQGSETVDHIERRGGRALAVRADVSRLDEIDEMVAATLGAFGAVDILVNNAGGMHPFTPFLDVDEMMWEATLERNLKSVHFTSRRVVEAMRSRNAGGRIINIASVEVERPFPGLTAYSAAKAAVASMTRSLAVEFARDNILVNTIAPGPIYTPNTASAYDDPEVATVVKAKVPLGRIGHVDEIATAALFLASGASSFVTGSFLAVDGGFLAG